MTKRITISVDEGLYSMIRIKHQNMSKYLDELIKADMFKSQEQRIYDAIIQRAKADGYIQEPQPIVISSPSPWGSGSISTVYLDDSQNDFQRAKLAAQQGAAEPVIVPDSQERW